MRGNSHVRFLESLESVTTPGYLVPKYGNLSFLFYFSSIFELNIK
jgi:hypothetical protein